MAYLQHLPWGMAADYRVWALTRSVSIEVQKEDVCSHPNLEVWTYTHC